MKLEKDYCRHLLRFFKDKGLKASEAWREITSVYGDDAVSERTCRDWYAHFTEGREDTKDKPRSGRPSELDASKLLALVGDNPRQSTRELGEELGVSHMTVNRHLQELGFVNRIGTWVPHQLTPDNRQQRVSVCHSLLLRFPLHDFIRQIVTGDEKWVIYIDHTRKRQWVQQGERPDPEPKGDLHPRKQMLSIFWDYQGVIYFELLPSNTHMTATLYCTQLQKLREALNKTRPGRGKVRLLVDNAKPHTAKVTRETLEKFRWEVVPHPPYSPDLAPSDYHLFRSLQNHLKGKKFDDQVHLESDLKSFFDSKPEKFYSDGFMDLQRRWERIVDNDGDYFLE